MHTETEKLIRDHVDRVYAVAKGFHFANDSTLSTDDLYQAGCEKLVECAYRYDPTLNDTFWNFAYPRVRGAMQDAIRSWFHWDRTNDAPRETMLSLEQAIACTEDGEPMPLAEIVPAPEVPCMVDVWNVLTRLPEREREAMVRGVCGDSNPEIIADWGLREPSGVSYVRQRTALRLAAWGYA